MQYRPMEITIISAKNLKRVKHLSKMDVYVLVSLSGGPQIEQKTPVDKGSGPNPTWAKKDCLILNFRVMCHRRIHSDKEIGEANVPVKELLDNGGDGKFVKHVTYQLRKPNGKLRGELNLSYKFADQVLETSSSVKVSEPATVPAYPPLGYPPAGYAAPPPPFNGGFSVPQQQAFGQGYVPEIVRPQSTSSENTEVDAVYLSGVLEGLLIGQMMANGGAGGKINISDLFGAGFTTTTDAGPEASGTIAATCDEMAAGGSGGGGAVGY